MRVGAGEIAIERHDAVGLGKISDQFDSITKSDSGRISSERFVLIELGRAEFGRQHLRYAVAGRAVVGTEQETDFCGLVGNKRGEDLLKIGARRRFSGFQETSRTRGRVKIQNRSLCECIRALGIRMEIVRRKLGWASFKSGHHQRRRTRGTRHRGSVVSRLARDHPFRCLGVGDNVSFRATACRHSKTSKCGRSSHQFQERTTRVFSILLVRHFSGSLWEFAIQPLAEIGGVLKLTRTAPSDGGFAGGNFGVMQNAFTHLKLRKK